MLTVEQFHKALSDPTRLRCLSLIKQAEELCVCNLVDVLDEPQPKISRHLAFLRKSNIVKDRRDGQWIYYSLNPNLPGWMKTVLDTTITAIAADAPYAGDLKRLTKSDTSCC